MIRRFLSLCAVLCAVAGLARGAELALDPFPSYAGACGYPLISMPLAQGAAAHIDPFGRARILLDPHLLSEAETPHRTFLIAHECGHHRLGHATPQGLITRRTQVRGVEDQELSADCWAAEHLARDGLFDVVRLIADRFWRAGPVSPGQGYPSGIQRSLILRKCGEVGLASPLSPKTGAP